MKTFRGGAKMRDVEKVRETLEKNYIRIPKHLKTREGVINYLKARKSVLEMSLIHEREKIKHYEEMIRAIEEIVKELEGDEE